METLTMPPDTAAIFAVSGGTKILSAESQEEPTGIIPREPPQYLYNESPGYANRYRKATPAALLQETFTGSGYYEALRQSWLCKHSNQELRTMLTGNSLSRVMLSDYQLMPMT